MSKEQIKQLIASRTDNDGLTETRIKGVRLFRATQAIPCVPAVYEPCVVAIVSGAKEAVLDGHRYVYDDSQYLCCPTSLPVETPVPGGGSKIDTRGVRQEITATVTPGGTPETHCNQAGAAQAPQN